MRTKACVLVGGKASVALLRGVLRNNRGSVLWSGGKAVAYSTGIL